MLFCFTLLSCADVAKVNYTSKASEAVLDSSSYFYVSMPKNGSYGNKVYNNSANQVSTIIEKYLYLHTNNILVGEEYLSLDDLVKKLRKKKVNYLIRPTILHWEDRSTEWSARPDKVSLKIVISEVISEKTYHQ